MRSPANDRRVTKRWPDPDSNNFWSSDTGCSRLPGREKPDLFPDLPQGASLCKALGVEAAHGEGPGQAQSQNSDTVLTLHTPCFLLWVQRLFCSNKSDTL